MAGAGICGIFLLCEENLVAPVQDKEIYKNMSMDQSSSAVNNWSLSELAVINTS